MKDGEPCTSRGVSTVLEGVTPRPRTKGSMAWRFLPYELYTMQRYLQYGTLVEKNLQHFDAWASTFGETVTALEILLITENINCVVLRRSLYFHKIKLIYFIITRNYCVCCSIKR